MMMRPPTRSFAAARAVCLPALLAAVLFLARAASAQQPAVSDSDLRRENDQLKQRVAQLETQLAEAQRRAQTMQTEIERLRKLIASGGGGGKSASPTTPDAPEGEAEAFEPAPEEPLASPASMFNTLVKDYEKDLTPLPRESRQDQQRYLAEARKWAAKAIREIKGKVDWTISNVSVTGEPRGERDVSFQVVNPANGKPYGPVVTAKMRGDLAQKLANQPPESQWKITGMANAAPKVVPERDKPGAFDKPQSFIGPYVEFAFELNTLTVTAVGGKTPAKP
jgi:hypothetical protein